MSLNLGTPVSLLVLENSNWCSWDDPTDEQIVEALRVVRTWLDES